MRMGLALKAKTSQFVANILPIIREIQNARHGGTTTFSRVSASAC